MMRRAGEKEIAYLMRLAENDPDNRKHCIHMHARFDHEDHLCMVFEAMHQARHGLPLDCYETATRSLQDPKAAGSLFGA